MTPNTLQIKLKSLQATRTPWLKNPSPAKEARLQEDLYPYLMALQALGPFSAIPYFDLDKLCPLLMTEFRHFRAEVPAKMGLKEFIDCTIACYLLGYLYHEKGLRTSFGYKGLGFFSELFEIANLADEWFFQSSSDAMLAEVKAAIKK